MALVGGAALVAVMFWQGRSSTPGTPRDCLRTYYDACQAGDLNAFTSCLAEPLRTQARTEFADPADLRGRGVKSWTCVNSNDPGEPETRLDVDEVRESSVRRVRFRLEHIGRAWLITAITPLEDKPSSVPYGKDIRDP